MKGPRLVLITWMDSHYVVGWHTDEPNTEPLLCRSVGWLLHDGDRAKTIAPHVTDEETPQRSGEITIPTASVVRIEPLDTPRGPDVA